MDVKKTQVNHNLGRLYDSLSCGVAWTMEARRVHPPRAPIVVKSADFEVVTVWF